MKSKRKGIIVLITAVLTFLLIFSGCTEKDTVKQQNDTIMQIGADSVLVSDGVVIENKDDIKNEFVDSQTAEECEETVSFEGEDANLDLTSTKTESAEPKEADNYKCTIIVRCDDILDNFERLDKSKHNLIPEDGVIYFSENVEFNDGESVFDILVREMKANKIHLEFEYTPAFENYYVEGIGNIYEFDCGDTSGWLYKVNGQMASCGSSQYFVKANDVIEWIYHCG